MTPWMKFIGAALLLASVYGLVLLGKLEPMYFLGLAASALSALGIHAAVTTPYPTKTVSQPVAVNFGKKE